MKTVNLKHYQKDFQSAALRWWSTLSINEMKAFERAHGIVGRMARKSEIAAIYDARSEIDVLDEDFNYL